MKADSHAPSRLAKQVVAENVPARPMYWAGYLQRSRVQYETSTGFIVVLQDRSLAIRAVLHRQSN